MAFDLEPREAWLDVALGHLDALKGGLRPGVEGMASSLLCGLECGPIPYPYAFVTGDGCYAIQWESVDGCRLSITVVGGGIWRYALRKGRASSGRQTVRKGHANRIRNLIVRLYSVNKVKYMSMVYDLFSEGEWE